MSEDKNCNTFFIRHTESLDISKESLKQIFDENKIAIHFPTTDADTNNLGVKDAESTNPNHYKNRYAKGAMTRFNELKNNGGYVWAQYYISDDILVGKVPSNSSIEKMNFKWEKIHKGRPAILKTLQLKNVKRIKPFEAWSLRAGRPRQGTICHWRKKEPALISLIEGKPLEHKWENLSPDQQEVVCTEFLKYHDIKDIPRLKYLLLPVGRTLQDVDIYGLTEDNKSLYSQVTFFEKKKANEKVDNLRKCHREDNELLFFCRCDDILLEGNILYIPIKKVEEWLLNNTSFKEAMFKPEK